ncbi:MAG: sigma 54-interacting transcriptional regulator [Phycisphaerales bacterium]|nr:sigma 54-interacting transcriptional regulator [Phycisphaerales bacterium]
MAHPSSSSHRDESDPAVAVDRAAADDAELRVLRAVAEGTAQSTGETYFDLLVTNLAHAMDVAHALVTEFTEDRRHVRTLAFWGDGGVQPDFEYALTGTPCERVLSGQPCHHPCDVQALYPDDAMLGDLNIESYLGVPLFDSRRNVLGHLAVCDTRPMPPEQRNLLVFRIFADRAATELERLQTMSEEAAAILQVHAAVGSHLNRDQLFGAIAAQLERLIDTAIFGIELPVEGNKLQGHVLARRDAPGAPTTPTILPRDGTVCHWVMEHREWFVAPSRESLRRRFPVTYSVMERRGMESLCAVPLVTGDRTRGALFFMASDRDAYRHLRWTTVSQIAGAVAVALDDCLAHEEVNRLRDRLAAENVYLRQEIGQEHDFKEMIGGSAAMRDVLTNVTHVAPTDSTVLILGETGTGKELVARAIHEHSRRSERPLIKVNCAALPASLVESELFGHEKGAFTGATARRMGRFALADGGTIFLDEIAEMPLDVQVKLLRVLQEHEFEAVGSMHTQRVNVRVIAATNRDLARAVHDGAFRGDLYYRLNVFPIRMPPLRDRAGDVPLLARRFAARFASRCGKSIDAIDAASVRRLAAYAWPGNVRELENIIERAVILAPSGQPLVITEEMLGPVPTDRGPRADATIGRTHGAGSLRDVERDHIRHTLELCGWVVDGPHGAATRLQVKPSTLRSRMKMLGIGRPGRDPA